MNDEMSMFLQDDVENVWQRIENQPRSSRKRLFESLIDEINDADDESSTSEAPRN